MVHVHVHVELHHATARPRRAGAGTHVSARNRMSQQLTSCAVVTSRTNSTPERADLPSPRTLWSVRGQKPMLRLWCKLHDKLVKGAATWQQPTGGSGLALLGDSITESWRGTEFGRRVPRAAGVPRVLRETLGTRWPAPLVLGIAGDQTQHLLWRLQQGEAVAPWTQAPGMLSVLLIGTNNLGAGQRPAEAAAGVLAVASWLLRHTAGRVLVLATLPRADAWRLRQLCPAACRREGAAEALGRGSPTSKFVFEGGRRRRPIARHGIRRVVRVQPWPHSNAVSRRTPPCAFLVADCVHRGGGRVQNAVLSRPWPHSTAVAGSTPSNIF